MNKEKTRLVLALIVITLLGLFGWMRQGHSSSRTTWEYMTIQVNSKNDVQREELFNKAGGEGWELVAHTPQEPNAGLYGYYHFKRVK